ncbi:MAG: hypothetical protein ACRENK_15730 [Gemmatimonadaceae bacterium]
MASPRSLELVVGATLPAVPYPKDVLARGWRFGLDMHRVEHSDTWALAAADLRPWLLMLWCVSWQQHPVGSLPVDDVIIAAKIGMPHAQFRVHRETLLRGWYRCDNGRLYHPVITERVLELLEQRRTEAWRKRARRAAPAMNGSGDSLGSEKHDATHNESNQQHDSNVPRDSGGTPAVSRGNPAVSGTGTGTGTGTKTLETPSVGEGGVGGTATNKPRAARSAPTPKPRRKGAGTRMAEDWRIPDDWIAWSLRAYPELDRSRVVRLSLEFRDFWLGIPGDRGLKADWLATWRNNLRKKLGDG